MNYEIVDKMYYEMMMIEHDMADPEYLHEVLVSDYPAEYQFAKINYHTSDYVKKLKRDFKQQLKKSDTMYNNSNRNNYGNRNQNWYGNRGANRQQDQTKKSGASYTKMKAGKYAGMYAVNAWRKTKAGLMVAKAFPVSDVEHKSDKGNFFLRYAVEVSMPSAGTSQTYWCLMNTRTQKLVIKELSLVISPNGQGYTASGKRVSGFFGANYKRR